MARICVVPEHLRNVARELSRASEQIRDVRSRLSGAWHRADTGGWEGRHRAMVEPMWDDARQRASVLAEKFSEMARYLDERASAFEEADRECSVAVRQLTSNFSWLRDLGLGIARRLGILLDESRELLRRILSLGSLIGGRLPAWPWIVPPLLPLLPWWPPSKWGIGDWLPKPPWIKVPPEPVIPSPLEMPSRPTPVLLGDADPRNYDRATGCVEYAKARRPDLGPAGGGAANYIERYRDEIVRVTDQDTDLQDKIAEGYAVVWPREHPMLLKADGTPTPGYYHGHVAIVEEVGPDYVIVSQAGWGDVTRMKLTREQLESLYLIP